MVLFSVTAALSLLPVTPSSAPIPCPRFLFWAQVAAEKQLAPAWVQPHAQGPQALQPARQLPVGHQGSLSLLPEKAVLAPPALLQRRNPTTA